MLEVFGDFHVPLMRILDSLPKRAGRSAYILELFEQTYRSEIAPQQYTTNQSGNVRWVHNVRWSREKLKHLGFVDAPKSGVWRLTEEGHQWLKNHPNATHLNIIEKNAPRTATTSPRKPDLPVHLPQEEFFTTLQTELETILKPILGATGFRFYLYHHYLKIILGGYRGCHYEIIKQRDNHVIALHFEGKAEYNQERVQAFYQHLNNLSGIMGVLVQAGKFQNAGWTQVWFELPLQEFTLQLAKNYAEITVRFVNASYPILQRAYEESPRRYRSSRQDEVPENNSTYKILIREIGTIRAYLQGIGNISMSDEKLCDWVNFCYTFELYVEGIEVFSLISPDGVHPWYYERTKRLARLCALRAKENV